MALSQQELDDLTFLTEEEKLARDVYEYLCDKWGHGTHCTIKMSEQTHMDAIAAKAAKYGAPINVDLNERGVFSIQKLQDHYDELTHKGDQSLKDAIEVGIAIEELDIDDIGHFLVRATARDVKRVMNNLLDGSFNHLDAFEAAHAGM